MYGAATSAACRNIVVHDSRGELVSHGLTRVTGPFATPEDAWQCAGGFIGAVDAIDAPIEVIGNFVIPPLDSAPSRKLPDPALRFRCAAHPCRAGRCCALHCPPRPGRGVVAQAITRFVPLRPLLGGHPWPDHDELVRRFAAYGDSHGTWQSGDMPRAASRGSLKPRSARRRSCPAPPRCPLGATGGEQFARFLRRRAGQGGGGEDCQADREHPAAAEDVGQKAANDEQPTERQGVRRRRRARA